MTNQVLADAAQTMRKRGRTTHVLMDEYGAVCPLGAIALALGVDEKDLAHGSVTEGNLYERLRNEPAVHKLAHVINPESPYSPTSTVYGWNDELENDDRVLYMLDKAALEG